MRLGRKKAKAKAKKCGPIELELQEYKDDFGNVTKVTAKITGIQEPIEMVFDSSKVPVGEKLTMAEIKPRLVKILTDLSGAREVEEYPVDREGNRTG